MPETDQNNPAVPVEHTVALPMEWALKKVLGPTFDEIGTDLAGLYKKGRDRISQNGAGKVKSGTEDQRANIRVAWNTLSSGAFSDSDISVEYFGGVLAASKSSDGTDDKGIYYLDIIKSLSSSQLHMHYCIYRSLNNFLVANPEHHNTNLGLQTDVQTKKIYFGGAEIVNRLGLNLDIDLTALHAKGLIYSFESQVKEVEDPRDPTKKIQVFYVSVTPTSLGFQLYAVASNELSQWRDLAHVLLKDFPDITYPQLFEFSLEKLVAMSFL